MTPVARIFDSPDQARTAAKALEDAGYDSDKLFLLGAEQAESAAAPDAEDMVGKVAAAGELPMTRAIRCARAIGDGKAVIVVGAPFGYVLRAHSIMDDAGAAPAELMDTAREHNPSPFSDFIGMPCLEHRLSFLSSDRPLTDANWTLFPVKLRDKLTFNVKLIDNPAWLSSKLGLKTLKTDKPTTFNVRLINNPAWLSSKLGLKTLSENRPWRTSFGFPLLTQQQD